MKLTPEIPAPAPAPQVDTPAKEAPQGKTMTPPGFNLQAGEGAGPLAAAPSKEDLTQVQQNAICHTPATSPGPQWEAFATEFNKEFKSVLHVFDPAQVCAPATSGEAAAPTAEPKYVGKGEASGAELTAAQLHALFTDGQRSKLMDFMSSHVIPERLFNGDDIGHTTAQQRLLMASHILVAGKYTPGSFEQKVHARMCWHWVHITHHYAGATPAGALNQGMMGMTDHNNDVVLGSGKLESIFHGKGVKPEDLPKEYDAAEHIGPMPEGSAHKEAADAEAAKKKVDPEAKTTTKMLKTMPFEDLAKLQPGDWIWYYNANGSGIGSHSVIFSRWASGEKKDSAGVKYRTAICFSQGKPEWGGREHTANLGERFSKTADNQVSPVNYVTRVSQDSNPADTVDELLPKGAEKKEKALAGTNEKFISRAETKFKKPVDREKVKQLLRDENEKHIVALEDRTTEGQRELLRLANASDDIETLVRLTQRLRTIHGNTDINEANQDKTNESKGAEYEKISAKVAAEEAKIDEKVAKLDEEKTALETRLGEANGEKDTLDTAPEIKAMKPEFTKLDAEVKAIERKNKKTPKALESDQDYIDKKAKRDAMSAEMGELRKTGSANAKKIEKLKLEIAKLKSKLANNSYAHKAQATARGKAKAQLPFSLVHPGSWKGEKKGGTTGKLEDVMAADKLKEALGEGELPTPAPAPKKPKKK